MTKDVSPASGTEPEEPTEVETDQIPTQSDAEGEDQTLDCVDCGETFVFSANEQAFFEEKGLQSPPKRCKDCRVARRKARRVSRKGMMRDYRGPAFRENRQLDKMYRSPAFTKKQNLDNIYRSPAFQDREEGDENGYRSPAFQEQDNVEEIYRGPAFQNHPVHDEEEEETPIEGLPQDVEEDGEVDLEAGPPPGFTESHSPEAIYRSPAFSDTDPANYAPSYRRRQLHDIVCAECGCKAKVPFKPRKDRQVFCKECYSKKK